MQDQALLKKKLMNVVRYAVEHYPPIKKLYLENSIDIEHCEFEKLPFINKHSLNGFSYENSIAVPQSEIVRVFTTSGTTGSPSYVSFTQKDWDRQIRLLEQTFIDVGFDKSDLFYDMVPRSTIFAAYVALSAAERTGVAVFPAGQCEIEVHVKYIRDLKPTILNGLAFFVVKLGEALPLECRARVKILCLIGEFIFESIRKKLKDLFPNAIVTSGYGISEVLALNGCSCLDGFHYDENEFFVEVANPDENGVGELVFTNLNSMAMPLVRYKCGDIGRIIDTPCSCGNTHKRFDVLGRIDDFVNVKGKLLNVGALQKFVYAIRGIVAACCVYFPSIDSRFELHYDGNIDETQARVDIKRIFDVTPIFVKGMDCESQWKKTFFRIV